MWIKEWELSPRIASKKMLESMKWMNLPKEAMDDLKKQSEENKWALFANCITETQCNEKYIKTIAVEKAEQWDNWELVVSVVNNEQYKKFVKKLK
jgi:hypothetical protein